ncbi:MAG: hypothetical protein HA496_06070 [Thaumarchaeota archaeon]|nr:hypothetical protein [Nitrososphaerota archaeon]
MLSLLDAKYVFKQWVGFFNSTESSARASRGWRRAMYSEDYMSMMITVAVMSLVIIAAIVVFLCRRRKKIPSLPPSPPPPTPPSHSTSFT